MGVPDPRTLENTEGLWNDGLTEIVVWGILVWIIGVIIFYSLKEILRRKPND
jgi:hypothetical protein